MTGGSAHRARRLALWTLLLGVFLMHGSPSAAAEGCHGGAYSPHPPAAMATNASAPAARSAARQTPAPHSSVGRAPADAVGAAGPAHTGGTCTATPARGRIAAAAAPGAAVSPSPPALVAAPGPAAGPERRGPPGSGRELLLKVSVARR